MVQAPTLICIFMIFEEIKNETKGKVMEAVST
jgi:hypothetical protein